MIFGQDGESNQETIYFEASGINATNEINIERVNIRPRRFLVLILLNFGILSNLISYY